MIEVAHRHADFPKWRMPQDLVNSASQALPLLLLGGLSGVGAAGYYSIATLALAMPSTLVGQSVGSVFYPHITQAIRRGEDAETLIIQATRGLAWFGIGPFVLVVLTGPWLFGFVFGAGWERAGTYAQCLAPWCLFQLLNQPAVSAIPALAIQRGLLVYEVCSTAGKVLALWIGFRIGSDVMAIAMFSAAGSIAYAMLIMWVISCARNHTRETQP
jgi:O-antigen/teichoic acid export membrane protein